MTPDSFQDSGIVITDIEAIEFQKLVKEVLKEDIDIVQATTMGSNLISSLELISQNLFKIADTSQKNVYEHKSS